MCQEADYGNETLLERREGVRFVIRQLVPTLAGALIKMKREENREGGNDRKGNREEGYIFFF